MDRSLEWSAGEDALYLSSIDIAGFKSFARPTRLIFGPGITALVGPNGSGKSNIVDAVRWCLGEQSIRDLRGQRAEDVIYAGPRRQVGMAEVALTFTADGEDAVPWSQLSIARRLYRSGESEYLVSGRRVRLRDVLAALHDVGIDAGRHVVVTQGMADALLTASPRERRALLEQAAGLSSYRDRREDARQKLTLTQRNIDTIETVLAEIEPRLRLVRRQAQAAREREEVLAQLRERQPLWYAARWQQMETAVGDAEQAALRAAATRERAAAEVERLERAAQELVVREREWHQRLAAATEIHHKRQREYDTAVHAAEREESRVEGMRRSRMEQAARIARAAEELHDAEARFAQAEIAVQALTAERARLEAAYAAQQEVLGRARQNLEAAEKPLSHLQAERVRLEGQGEYLHRQVAEIRHRARLRGEELRRHQEWLQGADATLARTEQRVQVLEQQRQDAESRMAQAVQALDEVTRQAQRTAARTERVERLAGRVRAVHLEVQRAVPRLERARSAVAPAGGGLVSELRVARGWDLAVSAALGPWAYAHTRGPAQLAATLPAGFDSWCATLRDCAGTGTRWAEDLIEGLPAVHPLLATLFVETPAEAATLWDRLAPLPAHRVGSPSVQIATRDGMVWSAEGIRRGQDEQTARYLHLTQEIAAAVRRREVLERRAAAIGEVLERSRQEREAADTAQRLAEETVRGRRRDMAGLEGKLEQARRELETARGERKRREAAVRDLGQRLASDDRQVQALLQEGERNAAELSTAAQTLQTAQHLLEERRRHLQTILEEDTLLRRQLEVVRARLEAQTEVIAAVRREVTKLQREAQQPAEDSSLERIGAELEQLRRIVAERREQVEHSARELAAIRESAPLTRPPIDLPPAREVLTRAAAAHERALAALAARHAERETLRREIQAEIKLDPERLPPLTADVPGDDEIRRWRARAAAHADAEPGVVAECEELTDRQHQLQRHVADLQRAADDLRNIIATADREMRVRFRTAFDAVNDEFARVFRLMLRGGEAHLELIEEEGGVEIKAQLPGKRARSSAAFSGGERSLIASALLFGVLRIRPTPFCILDEVDAALDESNVDRYLAVLRDCSSGTQMLVVTHNRATMAAASVLYGLTMNDEGMSNVLSLKLEGYGAAI